jgi:hypothetical protein
MSLTPGNAVNSDQLTEVLKVIDQQLNKDMDSVRAKLYWQKALADIPAETLASALAVGLSSKRYQAVPPCQSCNRTRQL